MAKKATIADVAKAAEVSTATVSYILNQTEGHVFSEETIQRVNEAAKQLNYVGNAAARRLRSKNKSTGMVCIAYIAQSPRVYTIIESITDELKKQGMSAVPLRLSRSLKSEESAFVLNHYFTDNAAGVICLGIAGRSLERSWSNLVLARRIPFVTVDSQWSRNISSVEFDYFTGAYQAVQALTRQNIHKIYYLTIGDDLLQTIERQQGINRALFESEQHIELIVQTDPLLDKTAPGETELQYMREALQGLDEHSAVILDWADHNQHVFRLCQESNLRIPIMALEEGSMNPKVFPQLQYSYLPLQQMGTAAAQLFLRLLKDPEDIAHEFLAPSLEKEL